MLAQAIATAALAAVFASEPAIPTPQPFPWTTPAQVTEALVGGGPAACQGESDLVEVMELELQGPDAHYTMWVYEGKWVGARYPAEQTRPDIIWFGTLKDGSLVIDHSEPYKEGMDPCSNWLTPREG